MTVWREGGWIPAGKALTDPWGDPYAFVFGPHYVRTQLADLKAVLKPDELTEDERRRLDESGRPRLRAADRTAVAELLGRLGDDDYQTRERAQAELRARGPAVLGHLEDRLKTETDPEIVHRLQSLRKSVPKPSPAWPSEFGQLRFFVLSQDARPGYLRTNEMSASGGLKLLSTMEADLRSNDRDGNGVNDFWTGDVAGLCRRAPQESLEVYRKLGRSIETADAAPLEEPAERTPHKGYWFRALRRDKGVAPPEAYAQDTVGKGGPRTGNRNRFGFVCYPADYGVSGVRTFIVNESTSVFWKDTQGEPVEDWPDAAVLKREWTLLQ